MSRQPQLAAVISCEQPPRSLHLASRWYLHGLKEVYASLPLVVACVLLQRHASERERCTNLTIHLFEMKVLPPSSRLAEHFDAVRLYRDDIQAVLDVMARAGLVIKITDARFEYDSLDDLTRSAGTSPQNVSFEGAEKESLSLVGLSKSGRAWYLTYSGPAVQVVGLEIERILRLRQSKVHALPLHWLLQLGNLLFMAGLLSRGRAGDVSLALMSVGALVATTSLFLTAYWLLYPAVVLRFPHEAGFLSRNRDAILLLVVGAIGGGLVQYAISRLLAVR